MLNTIKFDAEKFETRTMPTPDLKSKEVIYWIRVDTPDKRLVTDLQRFLEGASQSIELHVPSAFIAVKTELESYRPSSRMVLGEKATQLGRKHETTPEGKEGLEAQQRVEERFRIEIILRRLLPESRSGQTQSPYG